MLILTIEFIRHVINKSILSYYVHFSASNAFSDDETDKVEKIEDSDKEESDTDSIDELSLKDAEVDLTDDQKAERQAIAEELKVAGNNAFKVGDFSRSIEKYTEGI